MAIENKEERLRSIVEEIRAFLSAQADAALVARNARYFREGYDAYGVEHAIFQSQMKAWRSTYCPELGLAGCLDLGDLLFASGKYEEGAAAIHLVSCFHRSIDSAAYQRLGNWLEFGVRNWAHCDVLCGEILSPCLKDGFLSIDEMGAWRTSPYKFKRRAVPVAMIGLLKTDGDRARLLEFIRPMMLDAERVVHQGLGWFLRDTWKVEPVVVEEFLLEWKDRAPRLIYQYATEKMTAEGKARFRRTKPER